MEHITLYAIPSISAIAIKFIILWRGWRTLNSSNHILLICFLSLLGVNVFELGLFCFIDRPDGGLATFVMTSYYVSAICSVCSFFALSLHVANRLSKPKIIFISMVALIGCIAVLIPGYAINGIHSIGYSLTRNPGSGYWILQLVIVGMIVATFTQLGLSLRRTTDRLVRRRSLALLIGCLPLGLTILIVVGLMQAGIEVNATVMVSLLINIFLAVFVYTEYEHRLFKFLAIVPATSEYKLSQNAALAAYSVSSSGLTDAVTSFEKAIIQSELEFCKGNKSLAASRLGISRTTLRRKLEDG